MSNEPLLSSLLGTLRTKPALAIRRAFREGYTLGDLRADVMAGIVVGIVALPLSMALAIASGVAPQYGLYTAIIAGGLVAVLGGSRLQITGPTAAFVVILAPIAADYGLAGLMVATMIAGLILVSMGVLQLGKLIQFIPHPVTTGFTAGIAIVIATLQIKDFLGLSMPLAPHHALERLAATASALNTISLPSLAIGLFTLAVLRIWPRWVRSIPAPLAALAGAAVLALIVKSLWPEIEIETINSRFQTVVDGVTRRGIPALPPLPGLPWTQPGPGGGALTLDLATLKTLVMSGSAIAMLGAIESLLSAVVADGMTQDRHDPDAELLALGIGNIVAPFFGGIAATGAIARTATNIRSGARSPIAAVVHSAFVLGAMAAFAPLLGYLPMPALSALLLLVAWNMSDVRNVRHIIRTAPRSDTFVLLVCLILTVVFDMVVSVTTGVLLASLLFMRRMADVAGAKLINDPHALDAGPLPKGTIVYEVAGPLFFGAAEKALGALGDIGKAGQSVRCVILDVRGVPVMDATGLVALESARDKLAAFNVLLVVAGLQTQPASVVEKAGWVEEQGKLVFAQTMADAVAAAGRKKAT